MSKEVARDRWTLARRTALLAGVGIGLGITGQAALRRMGEADLSGQVALITGGSRGLGFLLARELAREGCKIVICARDAEELHQARRDLEVHGVETLAIRCDITDVEQVQQMIAQAMDRFGRVDVLVNNAGIIQVGPLAEMTLQDFQQAHDVMYWGMVYPTLALLPQMLARKSGRIINITSIGGKVSVPHLVPYGAAKFAAVGFSEGLRAELIGQGIVVTTIAPGLMRTGSHLNAVYKGKLNREYTWMSLMATLPVISMDAERAARQIIRAAKRGEAERVLSVPATLLAWTHGVCPGGTANLMGLVARFALPGPGGVAMHAMRGMEVEERWPTPIRDTLTGLGRSAAQRFHEYPGPVAVTAAGADGVHPVG